MNTNNSYTRSSIIQADTMSCNTRLAPTTHRSLGRVSIPSVFPPFTHLTPPPPTIFLLVPPPFPRAQPSPAQPQHQFQQANVSLPARILPVYTCLACKCVCVCVVTLSEQPLLYSQSLSPRSSPDSRFLLPSFFAYSNKQLNSLSSKRIRRAFDHI